MRVVRALLAFATVTSLAQGAAHEETAEGEEHNPQDDSEENVGDEHYQTPEEAEDVHVEEDEEGEKQDEFMLTKEGLQQVHKAMDADGNGKVHLEEIINFGLRARQHAAVKYSQDDLKELDKTGDGKLSLEELLKNLGLELGDKEHGELEAAKFRAADADGDGYLNAGELHHIFYPEFNPKVREAEAQGTLKMRDTNGDGKLTMAEYFMAHGEGEDEELDRDDHHADFSAFDEDKDGFWSVKELITFMSSNKDLHDEYGKIIEIADMDGDGQVTSEELTKAKSLLEGSEGEMHLIDWATLHGEL